MQTLERFPRYGRGALLLMLAAVPGFVFPATLDLFNLAKLTLMWVLGLAAFWLWFAWSLERGKWLPSFNLGYATGAFAGAYALATIFSQNRSVSLLGVYRRYGGLVPLLLYAVIMALLVGFYWEHPDKLKAIPIAIAVGSAPVSLYAILQATGLDWVDWSASGGAGPTHPGSTLGTSNFLGGYLAMALPFIAYVSFSAERRVVTLLVAALLAAALAGLLISGSRGGFIAAGGGLVSMAWIYRNRLAVWMKAVIATTVGLSLAFAVLILWHPGMEEPPEPLADIKVLSTETIKLRSYYWSAAAKIFLDNFLIGTGPDTYSENYSVYRPTGDADLPNRATPDKPHNIYLEYASNSGVLGLVTFLSLVGMALRYGFRRATDEGAEKALLAAFLGGLVAYLTQGFLSMDLPSLALMGWVAIGGIAVLADPRIVSSRAASQAGAEKAARSRKKADPSAARRTPATSFDDPAALAGGKSAAVTVAGLIVLGLLVTGMRPLAADMSAKSATGRSASVIQVLEGLSRAEDLSLWGPTYRNITTWRVVKDAGAWSPERRRELLTEAHDWLLRAAEKEPDKMFPAVNLATLNALWAREDPRRFVVADRWWQRAVRLSPSDWRLRFNYGTFLGDWALQSDRPERVGRSAVAVLNKTASMRPNDARVWLALGKSYILIRDIGKARMAVARALRINPDYDPARTWLKRLEPRPRPSAGPPAEARQPSPAGTELSAPAQ